jgi:hypothetical protein
MIHGHMKLGFIKFTGDLRYKGRIHSPRAVKTAPTTDLGKLVLAMA